MPDRTYVTPWHNQVPNGCRRCGRIDLQHEGRGLCPLCHGFLRRHGGLWRYPTLHVGVSAGARGMSTDEHLTQLARRWQRERILYERAFLPGRWERGYFSENADKHAA